MTSLSSRKQYDIIFTTIIVLSRCFFNFFLIFESMAFIHERNDVEKHQVSAEPAFFLRKRWAKEQGNTNLNLDLLRNRQFN